METSYHKLLPREYGESKDDSHKVDADIKTSFYTTYHRHQRRAWLIAALFSIALNVIFVSTLLGYLKLGFPPSSLCQQGRLYSPAQHVLRRVDRVFDSGFRGGRTPYQGAPNETNNKLWQDLYNFVGISRISDTEAGPMVNHTLPIPGDPGYYITSLDVFHQLHCLNLVRQAIYGHVDWTNQDEYFAIDHLDHCIDTIRQSLQCNADITPLTWVWSTDRGQALEEARIIHTCVDFDAIRDWGAQHKMKIPFNRTAKVDDDPLGWGSGVQIYGA
ncbi:hypothetical protein QQS21_000871 [Conoideocrella luteorostrata]|uniref:Uncharacterized protein n=1 Tax=Conoideocrella luteorostrata TaxID=1105319 RepID=A0AAJ0G2H0_9HYPO|nr:hypothetical protein QQS21_000871 [Conoideocrella luteorostrata]